MEQEQKWWSVDMLQRLALGVRRTRAALRGNRRTVGAVRPDVAVAGKGRRMAVMGTLRLDEAWRGGCVVARGTMLSHVSSCRLVVSGIRCNSNRYFLHALAALTLLTFNIVVAYRLSLRRRAGHTGGGRVRRGSTVHHTHPQGSLRGSYWSTATSNASQHTDWVQGQGFPA